MGGATLSVFTENRDACCHLYLRGALARETVRVLEDHVDRLDCCARPSVVIDLTDLDHLDRVGARVLHGVQHYGLTRGCQVEIVGASRPTVKVLEASAGDLATELATA